MTMDKKPILANFTKRLLLTSSVLLVASCSLGGMSIQETHYYAVTNGNNTNYFRLQVNAQTIMGDAEYRSGWFPSRAVDNVFGDVSSENGARQLSAKSDIENIYLESVKKTTRNYLEKASDVETSAETLEKYQIARHRVRRYPIWNLGAAPNSVVIEYDPEIGIVEMHGDEKLIFILSSDPDEVVGNISNFAESDKTVLSIQNFTKVFQQRVKNDIAGKNAEAEVISGSMRLVSGQIDTAVDQIINDKVDPVESARREVEVLIHLINSVR